MSRSYAYTITVWEAVEAKLRRNWPIKWQGMPLSERDCATVTEAVVMNAILLMDLQEQHDGIGSEREIVAWAHNMCSLDVYALGSCLSDALGVLRNVSEPTTYSWFKQQLAGPYPFVGQVLAPVRQCLTRFLSHPTPRGFAVVSQCLAFLTRLDLADLPIDMVPGYLAHEDYLSTIEYDPDDLHDMNIIMRSWMKDFVLADDDFYPQHGPGASLEVNRAQSSLEKYRFLGTDPLIEYAFGKRGIDVTSYYPLPPVDFLRESSFVAVPKSIKTKRVICKESCTLMYLQQGVWRSLRDYIHGHRTLSRHIDFGRQELNGALAVEGSGNQMYSTIDLSSASDTVTYELVKAVFRGTPLYALLVALRSKTVRLPDRSSVAIAKYAPSGSALCFPVETLIFACATELAVRRARAFDPGIRGHWRAYGDDIIVDGSVYHDVSGLLQSLGFIINEEKSFHTPSRFRESCGYDGYDGVDVTPMRISRRFRSLCGTGFSSHHAALYQGYCSMANDAAVRQYSLLRLWLVRRIMNNHVAPPLFSQDADAGLWSPMPDNYRAPSRFAYLYKDHRDPRYMQCWQQMEIRVASVGSRPVRNTQGEAIRTDDELRYFEALRLSADPEGPRKFESHRPESDIRVPSGPVEPVLRGTWVVKPTWCTRSDADKVSSVI